MMAYRRSHNRRFRRNRMRARARTRTVSIRPSFRKRRIMRVRRSLFKNDSYFTRLFKNDFLTISGDNVSNLYQFIPSLETFNSFKTLSFLYEMFKVHKILVKVWPMYNNITQADVPILGYCIAPIYQKSSNTGDATVPANPIMLNNVGTGNYNYMMSLPYAKSARFPRPLTLLYKPKVSYVVADTIDKRNRMQGGTTNSSVYPGTISSYPWISTQGFNDTAAWAPSLSGFELSINADRTGTQTLAKPIRWNIEIFAYVTFRKRVSSLRPAQPALNLDLDSMAI